MQKQIKKKLSLASAMANLSKVAVAFLFLALPVLVFNTRARVEGATSSTLNFQARLHDSSGAIVADGDYHVEFKLYDVDTGGTELWTETRTTGDLVTVKNGYLSVYLGSVNAFPSTINWNEEHYLTMNIGGSGGAASWDGEMNPRIKLTAVPFAFQSQQLTKTDGSGNRGRLRFDTVANDPDIVLPDASGTVCLQEAAACGFLTGSADDYIQNDTTQQTDANFNIAASSGVAATIQGAAGQNIFVLNDSDSNQTLRVGSAGNVTLAADLAVNGGNITSTGALNITPGGALTVGATDQTTLLQGSSTTITSTGSENDITLTSADQIVLDAGSTVEILDPTVITANSGYQLRLANSSSATADLTTDTSGNLNISTSGSQVSITGNGAYQDDFDETTLGDEWTFTDARADSNYSLTNVPGKLQINVASGQSHDCFGSSTQCVRVMKDVNNSDAVYETMIDGNAFTTNIQTYGILVWQDASNYLRYEFQMRSGAINVATYKTIGGSGTSVGQLEVPVTMGSANGLRITKTGTGYSYDYSVNDGADWSNAGALSQTGFTVNQVGMYVINAGSNPATTANFEYFKVTQSSGTQLGVNTTNAEATLHVAGEALFRSGSDSQSAFSIQNSSSDVLLTANTSDNILKVGNSDGTDAATTLLVLDSATANPTASATGGAMYYNSDTDTFMCYIDDGSTGWSDCSGDAASVTNLQSAYVGGNTITTSDTNGALDVTLTEAANFTVATQAGSQAYTRFSLADGTNTTSPNQLLLIENLDVDETLAAGVVIQSSAGGMTTAIDASDAEITNALSVGDNTILGGEAVIDFTNFDVDGSGNITAAGDLAANGGNITSTGALNVTPGGAMVLGSTSHDATLQGAATSITSNGANNDITLTSADQIILNSTGTIELQDNTNITGNLDISGTLTAGSSDSFQVNSSGAIAAATGITSSGTITFSGLDCSGNANGGAITADENGVLSCTDDNDTTANAFLQGGNAFGATAVLGTTDANDLEIVTGSSATTRITVSAAGATTVHGSLTAQSGLTVSGAAISLNENSNFNTNINSGSSTGNVTIGNASGTSNVTISANSGGSINIGAGSASKTFNIGNGGGSQTIHLGSTDGTSQTSIYGGTNNINLTASGSSDTGVVVRHSSNSANALLIQTAGGSDTLFRADTSSNRLFVGNQAASSGADTTLLVVDSASTTNLPSGVNGGIIYDSTEDKFKIYEDGEYKEICNMTDLGCGAGATVSLQDAYDNSSPATIEVDSTNTVTIKSASGDNSSTMFQLQNGSGQSLFVADTENQRISVGPAAVPANGVLTVGTDTTAASGGIYFGTDTNLYRSDTNTLKTDDAFNVAGLFTGEAGAIVSGAAISLNASSNFATNINTGNSTGAVTIGNNTGNPQITIDSGTGTINIGTGAQARNVNLATGGAAQTLTMGSTNGASSTLIQGGTGNVTINANGTSDTGTIVTNSNNSENAFQIQSSGSSDVLFRADTTNNRVYVGNATASSGADTTLLVVDSTSTTNLPTGTNGGIVYDSTANKFKVYEDGAWKTLCNTVDAGCGATGTNQDLQEAYDNSTTPALIETSSDTKNIILRSGDEEDSTGVFQIQRSDDDVLFQADTLNNRLYVGDSTGASLADTTLLVLDSVADSDYLLTAGVNGSMVYDADNGGRFMVYDNGWKELCNKTDLGCGSAGVSQSLQDAYNNSDSDGSPLITTTSATKNLIFRSGPTFDSTEMFSLQDASGAKLLVADTDNFRVSIGSNALPANGVLTVGTDSAAASGGIYFGTDTNLYRFAGNSLRTDGNLQLGEGDNRTFDVQGRSTNSAGNDLSISAGDAGSGASAFSGGSLTLQGGSAAGTGDAHGGDVILSGGTGIGNGARGLVVIDTPTFVTTSDDANCYTGGAVVSSSCTISDSSVNNSSHIVVGFDSQGQSATLPDPLNNATPGRIIYITGANGSLDFTLEVNGGGQGNEIAMRANTSATMVWNGADWTAAGASSSTTLQAAYNNTLTSAGGAEIVLNNTTSSNGLTVRNNMDNPIMGAVYEVQSAIGNNLFSVNNNAIDYASNGGAELPAGTSTTFPSDTWEPAPAGGTMTRYTSDLANVATGQASAEVVTTAANHGIINNLTDELATNTTYQVSFTGKLSSGTFDTIDVYYTRDGGTATEECVTGQTLVTSEWRKVTCSFTTDGTAATNSDIIIRQSDGTGRTFYIDNLSVTIFTATSNPSNVQIGGGIYGGSPTLLTLDRFSSAPVSDGNEFFVGSMYYDTTIGRIQCYESSGWGSCGSPPDTFVNLVPEYPGAVLNGDGVGTMAADFCSNSGTLSVNSGLCSSGQALNYYQWTSPQASEQVYSIYVTYQLPAAFKKFDGNESVTLSARTDSSSNGSVTYEMFRSEGGSLVACGSETTVTTSANLWQTVGINGDEETGCGFSTSSANNNVIFKINVKAKSNANVYVGTLSFTILGQ